MGKRKVVGIVVAGGTGTRLKSRIRKPFVRLAGRPMLSWTLAAFQKARSVDGIVVVVHPTDIKAAKRLIRSSRIAKVTAVVPGGNSRTASVYQGLKALPLEAEWVLVHDGARPLVTPEIIEETLKAARRSEAAIAAVPVVPTIKRGEGGWVAETLNRNHLWAVQTPQVFRRRLIEQAHAYGARKGLTATDDAALVERLGRRVRIVMGSHRNIKVTTPEDLVIAEAFLRNGQ